MSVYNNRKILILNSKGFSLMEMLTAIAIFIIVILIITNIFLLASREHRHIAAVQKVQSDARFALEIMAREARMD
ncbi:MAG: prepilin-type N-terminal cleavage/methylation domain-containing protein, partial [bacterium]